jgi:hypothetical protein
LHGLDRLLDQVISTTTTIGLARLGRLLDGVTGRLRLLYVVYLIYPLY